MSTVKIKCSTYYGKSVPDTEVQLVLQREAQDSRPAIHAVLWNGRTIGYVWKGTRTYSPPTHKGSRIARFHKQVPEWQAADEPLGYRSRSGWWADTRQEVLSKLIASQA